MTPGIIIQEIKFTGSTRKKSLNYAPVKCNCDVILVTFIFAVKWKQTLREFQSPCARALYKAYQFPWDDMRKRGTELAKTTPPEGGQHDNALLWLVDRWSGEFFFVMDSIILYTGRWTLALSDDDNTNTKWPFKCLWICCCCEESPKKVIGEPLGNRHGPNSDWNYVWANPLIELGRSGDLSVDGVCVLL